MMGTKFTVYNNGLKFGDNKVNFDRTNVREELAAICYETNVLGFKVSFEKPVFSSELLTFRIR